MSSTPTNSKRAIVEPSPASENAPAAPRRIDRLAEVVDLCTEARKTAQTLDEKLLSYLLAMAIQETRAAMRQQVAAAAGPVKLAGPRAKARRLPA